MSDINDLSGIEFEHLCRELLVHMGLRVEMTKESGDGGIDLYARCDKPVFSGTYLVQCKRYAGSVGEPVVRDLYGVVTAERANKGILITSGTFTNSATEFAHGKNLELIDGSLLNSLMREHGLFTSGGSKRAASFLDMPGFDRERYNFYKELVAQPGCDQQLAMDFIYDFLFSYLRCDEGQSINNELVHAGLAEEFIRQSDWCMNKFYKRGKAKGAFRSQYEQNFRDVAAIYNFDLFDYVKRRYLVLSEGRQCRLSVRKGHNAIGGWSIGLDRAKGHFRWRLESCVWLKPSDALRPKLERGDVKYVIKPWVEQYPEWKEEGFAYLSDSFGLLSIFRFLDIPEGVDRIKRLHFGVADVDDGWLKTQPPYAWTFQGIKVPVATELKGLSDGKCVRAVRDRLQDFTTYYEEFAEEHKDKIMSERQKIIALLKGLPELPEK